MLGDLHRVYVSAGCSKAIHCCMLQLDVLRHVPWHTVHVAARVPVHVAVHVTVHVAVHAVAHVAAYAAVHVAVGCCACCCGSRWLSRYTCNLCRLDFP